MAAKTKKSQKQKTRKRARGGILRLLRESWFYRIYFGALVLCAVGLIVGLNVLGGVLAEYEETRPVHSAEAVLEMVQNRDWASVYEIDESAKKLTHETPEQYAQYVDELTRGMEFSLKSVISLDEGEQKYSILAGDSKFAELALEHSGETTPHHFEKWRVKRLETQAFASSQYTITVPADSTVRVNGEALTQDDVIETGIAAVDASNLPEGVAAPQLTKYGVYMATGEPEDIQVTDRNGNAQELTQDDERSWSCGLPVDDATIKATVEEPVVQWGRRLAAYTTGDYDKIDLSNACVNPSPARTYIRNMDNQWAAKHSGYDFQNIQTSDYHVYSNDCFSCRISFDYIVHYSQEDKSYPTKYTLYFAKNGGTFKLYSFTMD